MTRASAARHNKETRPPARRRPRTHLALTTKVTASKLRERFAEMLNRVAYRRDRLLVERHGKIVAAVIPAEDLEILEQLEDRLDLEAARAALAEAKGQRTRPWEKIKAALGL